MQAITKFKIIQIITTMHWYSKFAQTLSKKLHQAETEDNNETTKLLHSVATLSRLEIRQSTI